MSKWRDSARDPLDAYSEWRDAEMVRDIVEQKAKSYVLNQVSIGYKELTDLIVWRFHAEWMVGLGDRQATWSEAEFALREAIRNALVEMAEVRALALDEGSSLKESPDLAGGSSPPSAAPSAFKRFLQRITRNPWL